MSERKNIDKLFQEQFKDFEVNPPEHTWAELERRLKKNKNRKAVPIWWQFAGVAAALVIGMVVGNRAGWFGDKALPKGAEVVDNQTNADHDTTQVGTNPPTIANPVVQTDTISPIAPPNSPQISTDANRAVVQTGSAHSGVSADKRANASGESIRSGATSGNSSAVENRSGRVVLVQKNRPANGQNKRDRTLDPQTARGVIAGSQIGRENEGTKPDKSGKKSALEPVNNSAVAHENAKATRANNQITAHPSAEKAIVEHTHKSSEAATTHGTGKQAEGNQKTELTNHTTDIINTVAAAEDQKKLDSTAVAAVPNALEELLKEKEKKVTTAPQLNRWQVTSNIAPIYFGSTSAGSPIDSTFAGKSKDYQTQVSYGIGVNYAINKRLTVRTGVNKVSLSYDTNDVELFASLNNGGLKNVEMPAGNETLNFARHQAARGNEAGRTQLVQATGELETDRFTGTINQKMGYIEVPVELSYALVDKKFGVNVIAGVSTLFLSDNEILLTSDGLKTDLGKASNLNQTHFSSNIGLGVRYRFLKSFEANFEPIFKYQINTFSKDSGDFKPYFFGLYTGVSFRF